MILVLGRPGSGCTTLLKAISGQLDANCTTSGELNYARRQTSDKEQPSGARSIYCRPDDLHIPTLTVEQTLDFALRAKLSSLTLEERRGVLLKLLQIFNISHQAGTVVGDAFLRGISGGEKKRLSIAEALLARPEVACWDNSTLGLDAGSAVDFARSLRVLSDVFQTTTFASLYQASDSIYDLFDKVLVLEKGQQLYFGPSATAKEYFQSLGFSPILGQPITDFIANCADTRSPNPATCASIPALTEAYSKSSLYRDIFTQQPDTAKNCLSVYKADSIVEHRAKMILPYYRQIWLTGRRHMLLRLQDRKSLVVKAITAIIVSVIIGTVYWQQPETSAGAFTRGGVIFITLLYNAFAAFVELPLAIAGRPILHKQTSYGFYRPSALYTGQFVVDVVFAAIEVSQPLPGTLEVLTGPTDTRMSLRFSCFRSLSTSWLG